MHGRFATSHSALQQSSDRPRLSFAPKSSKLAGTPRDARNDIPLRAKSVSLTERPRSQYARNVRSADNRLRYADKFFHQRPSSKTSAARNKQDNSLQNQQNKKTAGKIPCAVSVQTLSIPMKYADVHTRHSTFKSQSQSNKPIDINKTKPRNPPIQVNVNKRLCQTVRSGKETENKLLVQISEAEQVSDFERILNCNAIQCERAHGHVWRRCLASAPSAAVLPRPRSSYSLYTVSQAYHYLFQQHEESIQPLIDRYRQENDEKKSPIPESILQKNWYENLQDLSEFYEDDLVLQEEIETITDRIINEEVNVSDEKLPAPPNKYFNVNLASLIGLQVTGEGYSPVSCHEYASHSPDAEKDTTEIGDDEKEWLTPIMNANSNDQTSQDKDYSVDGLAQGLDSVKIHSDAKLPTITFSNCCEGQGKGDLPNHPDVVINLTVPSIDSIDEARPPMM